MKFAAFGIAISLFLFVLPVPGTIALRYSLLLLLLSFFFLFRSECRTETWVKGGHVGGLLAWLILLSLGLIAQAVLVSNETRWAVNEISSQWLPAVLTAVVGVGAVSIGRITGLSRQKLLGWLVLVLFAQTVFSLIVTVPDFLANGAFPQAKTALTAGKLEISYWNNLLLAFLAVDGLSRWRYRQALTTLPGGVVGGGIVIVFLSNLAFGARNGMIGSLLLLSSLALLVLWHERQQLGVARTAAFVGGAIALIGALGWGNFQLDPRWERFEETALLAWQSGKSDVWLHPDGAVMPSLQSGESVEPSAYFRIAWIRAGLDLIAEHPWGVGYGRNAFGHALRETTETRLGHAHSGLVDWTIGVGVPGLILWLGFLSWLVWLGIRRYFVHRDPAGLILTFVVGGFFGRMLLDSINRDHMLMVFFLILAMLVALPDEPVNS